MVGTAAALAGGALLGGIGGAFGKKSSTGVNVSDANSTEQMGFDAQNKYYQQMQDMVGAGPGQYDVSNALDSQRNLSKLMQQYAQSGGMPSAQDLSQANGYAGQVYAGQRNAMQQQFQTQGVDAQRQAATMGRGGADPILMAKLMSQQNNMYGQMQADQTAYGANMALGMADRRVGYAQGAANVDGQLAAQAQQNRAALLGIGSQIGGAERNFRLNTASHTQSSGGSMGDVIGGAFGGAGMGMNIINGGSGLGNGGGAPMFSLGGQGMQQMPQQLNFSQALAPQIQAPMQNFTPPTFGQSLGNGGGRTYTLG